MTATHPTVHYRLEVSEMSCGNCVAHVKEALLGVDGVTRAKVDLESGSAMVGGEAISPDDLVQAVAAAGYTASSVEPAPAPHHGPESGAAA